MGGLISGKGRGVCSLPASVRPDYADGTDMLSGWHGDAAREEKGGE
jgi:hypothetical protein